MAGAGQALGLMWPEREEKENRAGKNTHKNEKPFAVCRKLQGRGQKRTELQNASTGINAYSDLMWECLGWVPTSGFRTER